MQLDWDKAINEILAEKMTCQACGAMGDPAFGIEVQRRIKVQSLAKGE